MHPPRRQLMLPRVARASTIRHHSECTSKAAYHLVETSKGILDELKSQKVIMGEQCELLKTVAANQVQLSKLMKAVGVPGAIAPSPPSEGLPSPSKGTGGTGGPSPAPAASPGMGLMALRLLLRQLIYRLSLRHIYQHFLWLDASGLISQLSPRIMNRTKAVTPQARPTCHRIHLHAKLSQSKWWTTAIP